MLLILALWKRGELYELFKEVKFKQSKLRDSKRAKSVGEISKAFSKLLDKETASGILPISSSVMEQLKLKHPPAAEIAEGTLI